MGALTSVTVLVAAWSQNRRFAICTAVFLTSVIRLGVSFGFQTYNFDPVRDHWAFGYEWGRLARWVVEAGTFSLDGISPYTATDPLYVLIVSFFFYLFGTFTTSSAIGLIVLQIVFDALAVWAIFLLSEKLCGPMEARLASLVFAVYPAAIFFAVGRIGPSTLTTLLLCIVFLLTFRISETPRVKLAVLAGLVLGLLILASSKPLSLLVLIPLWLCWVGKARRLRMALMGFLLVATTVAVMLPWAIRNSVIEGHPTISKQGLGLMVWVGNNPEATGYTFNPPDPPLQEREYWQLALSWIKDHPVDFILLTLKRIIIFWTIIPGTSMLYMINGLVFMLIASLAVFALVSKRHRGEKFGLLLLFFGVFPLVFYLTAIPAQRHRFHLEPFMLIVASHGIRRLSEKLQSSRLVGFIPDLGPDSRIVLEQPDRLLTRSS